MKQQQGKASASMAEQSAVISTQAALEPAVGQPPKRLLLSRELRFLLLVIAGLGFTYITDRSLFLVLLETLSDAYLGVSVFVALTLAGFYLLDRYLKADLIARLNHASPWQVPVAALLGALPGCGGAIIVVTQFVHGQVRFGALVAVLISTMGDAAFLLLARDPASAAVVFACAMVTAVLSGYLVNALGRWDHIKEQGKKMASHTEPAFVVPSRLQRLFWVMLLPGALFGLLGALRLDEPVLAFFHIPPAALMWFGLGGTLLCIAIWFSQPMNSWTARFSRKSISTCPLEATVAETSCVSVWVVLGFVAFELLVHATGLDLKALFLQLGIFTPLLAVLIGFIPGCGPQIIVTTLYLNGVIPFSALLANAISNDGDALFPAIALAPRAAIVATLLSAIPALLLGYVLFGAGF